MEEASRAKDATNTNGGTFVQSFHLCFAQCEGGEVMGVVVVKVFPLNVWLFWLFWFWFWAMSGAWSVSC